MRKYKHHMLLYIVVILLSLVGINNNISNTSALSYSSDINIGFTFNPTLSVSISSSDLVISSLAPGTTADSNNITVSVASNASYGYTLSAMMNGSNSNLTHISNSINNTNNVFSSIATNANLPNLDNSEDSNIWGYSYKNNLAFAPVWSNYSGLSNSVSEVLFNTDSNSNSSIDFKIAAKASSTQASGTYTGTINFTATTKLMPKTIGDIAYMQTFAELDETDLTSVKSSMTTNTTYILKDARDEQEYTIAKLLDGKIWMTKNLNLAGGTEITAELSDVPANYTLPTANGFQEGNKLPESSQTGFSNNTIAYIYNSANDTNNCTSPGCYSYYSWIAATAGSGTNITTGNTDAPHSICPKGWRLPNSRNTVTGNSDFYQLATAYGMNPNSISDSSSNTGGNFYNNAGPNTTSNFLLGGYYSDNNIANNEVYGRYWSSTVKSSGDSYFLSFTTTNIYTADSVNRKRGNSVRCILKRSQ